MHMYFEQEYGVYILYDVQTLHMSIDVLNILYIMQVYLFKPFL